MSFKAFSALFINPEQNMPRVSLRSEQLDAPFCFWALIACDHILCACMFVYLQKYISVFMHMWNACSYPQKKPAVSKSINCVSVYAFIPQARIFT